MSNLNIKAYQRLFSTRLDTLEHLLRTAEEGFAGSGSFLERRIAPDMAPLGTQIAFTCNQPRSFVLWCQSQPADDLDPDVVTAEQAKAHITGTKALLSSVAADDSKLDELTRIDLGPNIYVELSGHEYVNDFLIPNFYFHLVTAYNVLRMEGLSIGKRDYMLHLTPRVRSKD